MNTYEYELHNQYHDMASSNTAYSLSEAITRIWENMDQWKIELLNFNNEDWSRDLSTWSNRSSEEDRLTVIGVVEDVIFNQMKG